MLSKVFYPEEHKNALAQNRLASSAFATQAVRDFPWVKTKSANRKGVTARQNYVTMLTTVLLGLLDDRTPLMNYLSENKDAFGDPWTKKHGK